MTAKYTGPVVRVAPNMLSFSDGKVVRSIYNSKAFVKEKTFYVSKNAIAGFDNPLIKHLRLQRRHSTRIICLVFCETTLTPVLLELV